MSERIPNRIDHYRYTDKRVILDCVIKQHELKTELPRLFDAIVEAAADIEFHLEFDIDISSNRIVTGWVKTQVLLQCQRCMKDYEYQLACEISTAFVNNDFEIKCAETSKYDTFFVEKQGVSDEDIARKGTIEKKVEKKSLLEPRILIEDELLLALPQISKHLDSGSGTSCNIQFDYPVEEQSKDSSQYGIQQEDENPFAILKQLKKHQG